MVMVNASGWRVEKVMRTENGRVPDVRLRISWRGYWQADCRTSAEVADYIDLSTLVREAPHKYARAAVKPPWQSASELLDVLVKARDQSHQLAKTRSGVDPSPVGLPAVRDTAPLLQRRSPSLP